MGAHRLLVTLWKEYKTEYKWNSTAYLLLLQMKNGDPQLGEILTKSQLICLYKKELLQVELYITVLYVIVASLFFIKHYCVSTTVILTLSSKQLHFLDSVSISVKNCIKIFDVQLHILLIIFSFHIGRDFNLNEWYCSNQQV